LSAQGKLREAANLFEKADNTPLRTARDCYLVAHLHAIDGNFRAALRYLKKAVHKDPQSFSAWFVRGNCHHVLGQYTDAAACYSTCIALRPEFHWSWFNRGLAHYQLAHFQAAAHDLQRDHFQAAADDFDQAIALAPDLAEAYLNRGLAYEGCRRFKESVADLTRALELGSPRTQVYFLRAAVREKDGDRKGASRDRQEGLRLEPADEQSWIARGLARLPKAPKLALADFQQALKLNPRSFPALQNTAHVLADHLNDDRAAVNVLDKAVALCPDSAMAKAGRGVSLARLGKRKQALADGEAALLLDTRPPNLYQVACIYALTSRDYPQDQLRALQLLSYGLKGGFGLDLVDSDSDLDPLRKTPQFSRIVAAAKALQTR
jgi:tetratricopeptide (TPR) repeat protein